MRRIHSISNCKLLAFVFLLCAFVFVPASAQTSGGSQARPQPTRPPAVTMPTERAVAGAARDSEFRCGGFVTTTPTQPAIEIVGAQEEHLQRLYKEGDYVFIGGGAREGMKVGETFWVVRPRGQLRSPFTEKKGSLGIYTQEVGRVRIVHVRDQSSVALVISSCDNLLMGDLLRQTLNTSPPPARSEGPLDVFALPSGKQTGRIVLARDSRESVTRDQIVFIDLGSEDNVKAGDYLTVYRPNHKGVLVGWGDEIVKSARDGYESDEFHGGKYSIQSQRIKVVEHAAKSETVKSPRIRNRRPLAPRKIVGELVILHVEARVATAIVTRVAQEIHTGDHVEVQ